jgi:hypothetical protein
MAEPTRCSCEPGANAHEKHGRPGNKAADHGNPFTHKKSCIHSELQHTTRAAPKTAKVKRLRL